jgi:hypothetical protein
MNVDASLEPAVAARAVALGWARAHQDVFADRMVAAYLLGSLSYGGYSAAVSDIDLAVILADTGGDDSGAIQAVSESLRRHGGLHPKVSVFWASLPALSQGRDDGRFPAIDRQELAGRSRLLLGDDVAGQVARPAAGELLLESARFAITVLATEDVITEFHHPRRLLADPVWFTKAVLFPVRFLCSNATTTGRAATNDEAIAWYLAMTTDTAVSSLVRLAAEVRAGHPLDPAEVVPQLAAGLLPLYRHYIDDQTRHLRRADAPADLVTAFTHWRERLA